MLDPKTIRNVAIIAHDGAGKTCLTEALLRHDAPARASKDGSTSHLDVDPEETKPMPAGLLPREVPSSWRENDSDGATAPWVSCAKAGSAASQSAMEQTTRGRIVPPLQALRVGLVSRRSAASGRPTHA